MNPRNHSPSDESDDSCRFQPIVLEAAVPTEGGPINPASHRWRDEPLSSNFFGEARNFQLNNAVFVEHHTIIAAGVPGYSASMDKLRSCADPNAAVDSSARRPAPICHPNTRRDIRKKLTILFNDKGRKYKMAWLFGAAGTGKSAVGQTFSMECLQKHRLGAAFFFSRPNRRNRYESVIATLAYQLATHCSSYHSVLIAGIDKDHQIFDKIPEVQFRKLIIEPLLELRSQITTTYLILLDGVDECGANLDDAHEREWEQRELIKIIADAVRDYPELPLFWLLCSRPEEHLQDAYEAISAVCQRERLVIDTKCREEVEVVLRDGFAKIAKERRIIGSGGWPSNDDFDTVENAVAGLHVFGAAILKDIEHSDAPVKQLQSLIPFLKHVAVTDAGSMRSIRDMDEFYMYILNDVPKDHLPTTLKILGALVTMPATWKLSAQALCNFLRLDPNDFSSALRKVHSVINIPSPGNTHGTPLQLYHASFSDFLTDASRSKTFFIDKRKIQTDIVKLLFFWHELHSNLFHSLDQPLILFSKMEHFHDPLPRDNFKWIASAENHAAISDMICDYTELYCFSVFQELPEQQDEEILSLVYNLDLRHLSRGLPQGVISFLNWVYNQDPSSGFVRTQPENDNDKLLLTYLQIVTKERIAPARFPLTWTHTRDATYREYVIIGRNSLSIIIWITETPDHCFIGALNLDQIPDEITIQRYEDSYAFQQWQEHNQSAEL